MRLTKTIWTILGVALIVAAAVTLFMLYNGQMKQQDELNDSLGAAYNKLQLLTIEKGSLQADIAQLQADIAQQQDETGLLQDEIAQLEDELQQLEDERAEAEALALQLLSQAEARFIASAESIEYDEILFGFAQDTNLSLWNIEASSPLQSSVEGIEYGVTVIQMEVGGQVTDVLDFINTIVTYEAFKTSILSDFGMNMPQPLSEGDISQLEQSIRSQLYNEAVGQITTEQMVGFITEAIAEVAGPESDWPDPVITEAVADMAQVIKERLDQMVETEIYDPLSGTLAQMIEENIAGALVDRIIRPLAEQIATLIAPEGEGGYDESELIELLGEDITELMGDDIAGSLEGNIGNLLVEYVSNLIDQKVADSVAGVVDSQTATQLAATIEQLEMPSSSITLTIYTYEGD
jgi:cell division protein FtsB